ncbi:MAG: fused MFS/spermidine synthase, partial [Aeromicrobium sp.]
GGNLVVVASDAPIDADGLSTELVERGVAWDVVTGADLDRWLGNARVLTDQYAPVDQLLTQY